MEAPVTSETLEPPAETLPPPQNANCNRNSKEGVGASRLGFFPETPPEAVEGAGNSAARGGPAPIELQSFASTATAEDLRSELAPDRPEGGGRRSQGFSAQRGPYLAGDFVWGKGGHQLWWPGQVFDASLASDFAREQRRGHGHCVLVVFFGDKSFAWCDPAQLKPFIVEFDGMVRQASGKGFMRAVGAALDEFRRCLEVEMTCACVPEVAVHGLRRPVVVNAGVKEGVEAPDGHTGLLSVINGVPSDFLERFYHIAVDVTVCSFVEATVIRSWVMAFFRYTGHYVTVAGGGAVEHQEKRKFIVNVNEPAVEEDLYSQESGSGTDKSAVIFKGKSHKGKKQRSMAELIAGMDLDMEEDDANEEEEEEEEEEIEVATPKALLSRTRKGKASETNDSDVMNAGAAIKEEESSLGRRERKKSKYLSYPYTMMSTPTKGSEKKTPKKGAESNEDGESKSKLSDDPSETPSAVKRSGNKSRAKKDFVFEENTASTDEMLSELRSTALHCMHLIGSSSDPIVNGFFSRFRNSVYKNGSDFESHGEALASPTTMAPKTPGIEASGTQCEEGKCDNPLGVKVSLEEKTPSLVANGPSEVKSKPGRKRESLGHDISGSNEGKTASEKRIKSLGNEIDISGEAKPRGRPKNKSVDSRLSESIETRAGGGEQSAPVGFVANGSGEGKPKQKRKKKKEANVDSGASLILSFEKGAVLPSKEKLVSTFRKFGILNESKIEMFKDSNCATVSFERKSDAENAFHSSEKDTVFAPGLANCRLQYLPVKPGVPTPPQPAPKPPLELVKKSLESMITTLSQSSSQGNDVASAAAELGLAGKENLVDEMSGLLMKVNKLLTSPSTATDGTGSSA